MNNFQKYCAFYNHIRSGAGAEGGGGRVDACPRPIENKKKQFLFWGPFPLSYGGLFLHV